MTKRPTPPTAGEDAEQRKFLYAVGGGWAGWGVCGYKIIQPILENRLAFSAKVRDIPSLQPNNFSSRYLLNSNKSMSVKRLDKRKFIGAYL